MHAPLDNTNGIRGDALDFGEKRELEPVHWAEAGRSDRRTAVVVVLRSPLFHDDRITARGACIVVASRCFSSPARHKPFDWEGAKTFTGHSRQHYRDTYVLEEAT